MNLLVFAVVLVLSFVLGPLLVVTGVVRWRRPRPTLTHVPSVDDRALGYRESAPKPSTPSPFSRTGPSATALLALTVGVLLTICPSTWFWVVFLPRLNHVGPEVPDKLIAVMSEQRMATRLCDTRVDELRDVRIDDLKLLGPDREHTAGSANVKGVPTGPAGAPAAPGACDGTVTFVVSWTWTHGRGSPLELSLSSVVVENRAVWLKDVSEGRIGATGKALPRPGSSPTPTSLPVGAEITTALSADDSSVNEPFLAHDYLIDLPSTKGVALVVLGDALLVKGIGTTSSPGVEIQKDGKTVQRPSDFPALTFVPPGPGSYTIHVTYPKAYRHASTYTVRVAYGVTYEALLSP